MASGSATRVPILAILGLTMRRLLCIISESLFLIAGIVIGYQLLPTLLESMEGAEIAPPPIVRTAIEWYWVLLALLAAHILLWPVVPRLLGWFGIALWWALGVTLPLLIVAVPAMYVLTAYASALQGTE